MFVKVVNKNRVISDESWQLAVACFFLTKNIYKRIRLMHLFFNKIIETVNCLCKFIQTWQKREARHTQNKGAVHAFFSSWWLPGMIPDYKNTRLSCRLHADPPWQFCEWGCQPAPHLNFYPLTHVNLASSDSRLAPAVSCSVQIRSFAPVFNSGVNRANHADSCPNEVGKAEQFLLLIFWISSCGP